jgi:ferredoxin
MDRGLTVSVDHNLCVGNGRCLRTAPHVFAHNASRQSEVVNPQGDSESAILDAAENCPVGAITVSHGSSDAAPDDAPHS